MDADKRNGGDSRNWIGGYRDRFQQLRRLGEGAEGGTWQANDADAGGRRVVLKRIEADRRKVVGRAFSLLRQTSSPHLPDALALLDLPGGAALLVTAWVEGSALPEIATEPVEALAEGLAVARALRSIHGAGTHHGDVSPGNVLTTPTRGVVLTDFGQLGCTGTGTPGYLAPEVLGGAGGPAADRFALGALLCLRLFGQAPFRRPRELAALRSETDVRTRLEALAEASGASLGPELSGLLERLLHPDPDARVQDTGAVVQRLAQLHDAARGGFRRAHAGWWIPTRWSYRGADLGSIVDRLTGESGPNLVAVCGPGQSGRVRTVEELVQRIQSAKNAGRGPGARVCDGARLPAVLGGSNDTWLEAWYGSGPGGPVIGLTEAPRWPTGLTAPDSTSTGRLRAAALQAGAAAATRPLLVPVDEATGAALEGSSHPGVEVLRVRPWTGAEIGAAVRESLDGLAEEEAARWAEVLVSVTGGWSGRVVQTLRACAAAGLEELDESGIARLGAESVGAVELDTGQAIAALEWAWAPDDGSLYRGRLPAHVHDDTGPLGATLGLARRALGDRVGELARGRLAERRGAGQSVGWMLALDARDSSSLAEYLVGTEHLPASIVQWLCTPEVEMLPVDARHAAARLLIRDGEAESALHVLGESESAPVERARALQQLGRAPEALRVLEGADADDAAVCGARWRMLIDVGRGSEAHREADRVLADPRFRGRPGAETGLLWAGYAALVAGEGDRAHGLIEEAALLAEASAKPGTTARARQLQGNLALADDDATRARRCFEAAATAYDAAREPVGALSVRASLASLAVLDGSLAQGLESGRQAMRGLLARGQTHSLPRLGGNLVQLLARAGALDEAAGIRDLLAQVIEASEVDPADAARLARIDADLARARFVHGGQGGRAAVESRYVAAARALGSAQAPAEAVDAWLVAASLARLDGRPVDAAAHLAQARGCDPEATAWGIRVEALCQAAARNDRDAMLSALEGVRATVDVSDLREKGALERAWTTDRALLTSLRLLLPVAHPARFGVARRLLETLEDLLNKSSTLDRKAVRTSLAAEGSDRGSLDDLLAELSEAEPLGPTRAPARGRGRERGEGAERLMRMYRRLAREDRLEPLLEHVVDAMMELTEAERGVVVVRGARSEERLEVARELASEGEGVRFSRSVIERVLEGGEPVLSVDAAEDERFDQSRSISHLNLRSVLAVPLVFRGEILGAAYVDHRLRRGNFDEADLSQVEAFAELAALAVAHARALAQVRSQAEDLARDRAELASLLEQREAEVSGLREQVRSAETPVRAEYHGMVGATKAMQKVFRLVDRLSDADVPVVIYGESGTGKELVARAIHDAGGRAKGPFVAENCGAIPETLLESVFFGHAKGAFTGAQSARAGLFEAAHTGTIFLDEVGEMSPAMQTKLLRVLQEGEVRRVGENKSRPVDVRVIAASNRDLEAMVEQGSFRQDLYYRINVVKVSLPALRERSDDIPALVEHFLRRHGMFGVLEVSPAALRALSRYAWPGNIRELENEVQRWIALAEDRVEPGDLSALITGSGESAIDPDDLRIRPRVDRLERELIERALERTGRNQTRAAELLGLSRYGLQKKLKRLEAED